MECTSQTRNCPCPKTTCPNHGKCCDCIAAHKKSDSMVACMFPDNDGDKSMKHFYEKLKARFEG